MEMRDYSKRSLSVISFWIMSLQISYGFFPLDGIILPTGRQDNAIPKHKTLRREPSSDSLNHQKEIELGFI